MTHPRLFAAVFAITTALTPVGVFASDLPGSFQVASSTFTFAKEQGSSEQLVSRIMGAEVINAKSEKIGAINDLTFSPAGQIDLVVIGVGGFLGIGEKEVAVPYPTLSFDTTKDGERIARTTLTREDLDTAPRYQTRDGFRTGTGGKLLEQADRLKNDAQEGLSSASQSTRTFINSAGDRIKGAYDKARDQVTGSELRDEPVSKTAEETVPSAPVTQ